MKSLANVENFGGTDADNHDILLQAFEDHEAYLDVLAFRRHLIIGKKGSGKTAIFKRLITTKEHDFFAFGHTFSDWTVEGSCRFRQLKDIRIGAKSGADFGGQEFLEDYTMGRTLEKMRPGVTERMTNDPF